MIRALCAFLLVLAKPTHEQSTPISPCPNVFSYEPPGTEPGRWYGVVNLSTDSTLHSLWLNIVLDSKADILGNWVGDVSTSDNIDFKIENTKMVISPGPAVAVRFFVQYSHLSKAPRLLAIRLNGREICNANTPKPSGGINSDSVITRRPYTTTEATRSPVRTTKKPSIQPDRPNNRPVDEEIRPVFIRPSPPPLHGGGLSIEPPEVPQNIPTSQNRQKNKNKGTRPGSSYSDSGDVSSQNTDQNSYFTPSPPRRPPTVSKPDDGEPDYFDGGPNFIPLINITNKLSSQQSQCGLVTLNNPLALVVNGRPTLEGQWPWQIALYQTVKVNNKYICGGTLVSHQHVITAAHCVTIKNYESPVLKNTLTIFLGKHNLRTSVDGVQFRFVEDIIIHPNYNGTSFSSDVSILRLREPVTYTDWVRPACLWPDNQVNLNNVIGKRGSVVGWGYDDTGVATEDLTLVEMPVVSQETCIRSYGDFFVRFTSEYTYCAGYRNGSSVCNGDSGGGMVFKIGSAWYLRGLVSVSVARDNEYRCDPTHYVIFTDLAKFLPWIRENVSNY